MLVIAITAGISGTYGKMVNSPRTNLNLGSKKTVVIIYFELFVGWWHIFSNVKLFKKLNADVLISYILTLFRPGGGRGLKKNNFNLYILAINNYKS